MLEHDVERIARHVIQKVRPVKLPDEYFYCHASLCVLDVVYAVRLRYTPMVRGIVQAYCREYDVSPMWNREVRHVANEDKLSSLQRRIETERDFIARMTGRSSDFALFAGRARPHKKSEVVLNLVKTLRGQGIDNLAQLVTWAGGVSLADFKMSTKIRGVGLATLNYLAMLAGNDRLMKPDGHIYLSLCEEDTRVKRQRALCRKGPSCCCRPP